MKHACECYSRPILLTAEEIRSAVARIKPLLAHRAPVVQGAILANLVAIWLAGHQVEGDAQATHKLRARLLALHLSAVEELTAANAELLKLSG